jgi:hypothetical protein
MRSFKYTPLRYETVEREIREGEFPEAVNKAYKGDTKQLCDYLREADRLRLRVDHAALADLIEWGLQNKRRGRPRGPSPVSTARSELHAELVGGARMQLKYMRAQNGGRAPWGAYEVAVKKMAEALAEDGSYRIEECDIEAAVQKLRKGR